MPKKKVGKLTAEQAAQKAKPSWRVVTPIVSDAARRVAADESAPEMGEIKRKYFGEKADAEVKAPRVKNSNPGELSMVVMEPKTPSDMKVGRKAVLVDKSGKIVGEQG